MVCLYHCDDDGKCAASIVNQLGSRDKYPDQFIEMDYSCAVPLNLIAENEIVYIVDFSIDPSEMLALYDITKNIIWIDHHISAIKKYEGFPLDIYGVRSTKHSGCMLTYMYLRNRIDWINKTHEELIQMDEIPLLVNLCDDYDLWKFSIPETKAFHQGFATIPHHPTDKIWNTIDETQFNEICKIGEVAIKYRASMMEDLIKSYGYETLFRNYRCFVINQGTISTTDFDSIDASNYDILVGYIYDGTSKQFIYSLRSLDDGPDVREIAVEYGGGGHPHAAGFSSKELIFA